ncbi:short-chain alcohol dehydrogenase [Actinobacteria bacterium IMCC26207]|nr:short-chain alcohol dehydrogenase [Actinobacteria bacterium IMCC26207]
MEQFEGKVAVVTGAASGIGKALATAFADVGMKIVLADVEAVALEVAAEELRSSGADVFAVTADVAQAADVDRIGAAAMDVFGALHVACNNAGVSGGGLSWEIDLETWRWILDVDLWGVIHGVHTFTPLIIASGGGHIVNTASMAGLTSNPGMSPYNVAKHGVVTLSETLSVELQMTHPEVGVSVLCPGWVRTRINESERNRPDLVGVEEVEETDAGLLALKEMVNTWIAEGLQPAHVASLVIEAMRENRFYVLTHPEWQGMIQDRIDRMLSGANPWTSLPGN